MAHVTGGVNYQKRGLCKALTYFVLSFGLDNGCTHAILQV